MFIAGKKNKPFKNKTRLNLRMFLESEKKLLNKNYRGYYNQHNTVFVYNINPTDQITIAKIKNEYDQYIWKVSFPLKLSQMNYTTFFQEEKKAKIYIKKIIDTYI